MVVVPDTILETRGRSGRLDPADQSFGDQQPERVVDRLKGNRADLGADRLGDAVGRDVRRARDRAEHGQPLSGDLDATLTQRFSRVGEHGWAVYQCLESFQTLIRSSVELRSHAGTRSRAARRCPYRTLCSRLAGDSLFAIVPVEKQDTYRQPQDRDRTENQQQDGKSRDQ